MKHLPEYHGVSYTKARKVIKDHYGLARYPSDSEIRAEIDNLLRRKRGMLLDDKTGHLVARLDL